MNLFRVDFKQGKTDAADYNTTVHSLTDTADTRQIISLATSEERLNSVVSSWIHEPRRLTFECFVDSWITDYILSGTYEHERSISHYEVKVYRDNTLIFSGIIDTSALSYEPGAGTVQFTCYDKLKLFSLFADLTQQYLLVAGYTPYQILQYAALGIKAAIPIELTVSSSQYSLPAWALTAPTTDPLDTTAAIFTDIEYNALLTLPTTGGYSYSFISPSFSAPYTGWFLGGGTMTNTIIYVFAHKKVIKGTGSEGIASIYQARFKAVIIKVWSETCSQVAEYEATTDWAFSLAEVTEGSEALAFDAFFAGLENGYSTLLQLQASQIFNSKTFAVTTGGLAGHQYPYFYGTLLPAHIHPGSFYTTETMSPTPTDRLKVLQAVLLMYDCTLWAAPGGTIYLKSLAYNLAATPIAIADDDVIAMSVSRAAPELPDTSILDVLAGDTTLLQRLIKPFLTLRLAGWKVSLTIDCLENYTLALHSIITVNGQNYVITSLLTNYELDQYEITAWTV